MCGSPFGFCLKPKTGCHKMTHPNPSLNVLFGGKGAFVERGVSGQYCLAVEPSWPEHLVADVLFFPEQCLLALGEGQAFPVGPSMSHTMNRLTQVARGNAKPMKSAHTSTALKGRSLELAFPLVALESHYPQPAQGLILLSGSPLACELGSVPHRVAVPKRHVCSQFPMHQGSQLAQSDAGCKD